MRHLFLCSLCVLPLLPATAMATAKPAPRTQIARSPDMQFALDYDRTQAEHRFVVYDTDAKHVVLWSFKHEMGRGAFFVADGGQVVAFTANLRGGRMAAHDTCLEFLNANGEFKRHRL